MYSAGNYIMIQETEIWKDVIDYEGLYQISNFGKVKSLAKSRCSKMIGQKIFYYEKNLSQSKTQDGYLKITLTSKKKKTFLVHRLVAIHFIPNPENKPEVNHKDGNKENNNDYNLEWNTPAENQKHAYKNNLIKPKKGTKNGSCKLNESQVLEIRDIGNSLLLKDIAEKYNVGASTIGRILRKENWKHI